eukprot:SAG11_NODE_477_length_9118_cov_3.513582_2_plen_361_part_00
MFEFIDMANAAGIEPVVTTTAVCDECTAEAFGDLIDYCHDETGETTWGRRRIADGHPKKYDVQFFELGNEQSNPLFAEQVSAMEARATKLGLARTMFYLNPGNGRWLQPDAAAKIESLGIGDHAAMSQHVGAGGAVNQAQGIFAAHSNYTMGSLNTETNGGSHGMQRALEAAVDLTSWFNCAEQWCTRLHFRAESFCTGRSGHFDEFDQATSFYLPNMTWLQPPGFVHQMIADTWSTHGLKVTVNGTAQTGVNANNATDGLLGTVFASAQRSDDGKTVMIRVASVNASSIMLSISGKPVVGTVRRTTISSSDPHAGNWPSDPMAVSPQTNMLALAEADGGAVALPERSFTVFAVNLPIHS